MKLLGSNECRAFNYQLGFVATPGAVSHAASSFHGAALSSIRHGTVCAPRRLQRARVVALGAAPPPPPQEPEEENEGGEASATPEEQKEEITADDILSSPAFLKKKLEIVQKELIEAKAAVEKDDEALQAEKEKYVRLAADFENYRRRSMEDLRKQDSKSTAKVCKEILDVLDNFERATAAVDPQTDGEKAISNSYQAINKQLLDALAKLKVEPLDAVGQSFDPQYHEAIQRMESTEYAEDVVCTQFRRGYKIEDTLIRAAVVAVSSGPGPEVTEEAEAAEEAEEAGEAEETEPALDVEASATAEAETKGEVETAGGK